MFKTRSKLTSYRLVAIMLGLLRMKVDEAIEALFAIACTVFPDGSQAVVDRDRNTESLKFAIENLLEGKRLSPDIKMNDQNCSSERCKV